MEKILIIDDNKLVVESVKKLLTNSPYQLYSASNGIEGLCQMVEHAPDLIFIDAKVTKLDGFQFCALVKGKAEYSHIPLIIVLDQDSYFERAKAEALGAETVLSKPFGKSELMAVIAGQQARAA